jgi:hypothetical protein
MWAPLLQGVLGATFRMSNYARNFNKYSLFAFIVLKEQIQWPTFLDMSCMSANCDMLATEDFVSVHVTKDNMREKYNQLGFQDHVR